MSIDFCPRLCCTINSLGELDVTFVIGLCCGESDTRLMTYTVSESFQVSLSGLMNEEMRLSRIFACSISDKASTAYFDLMSKGDDNLSVLFRFMGRGIFRFALPVRPFLGIFCLCFTPDLM